MPTDLTVLTVLLALAVASMGIYGLGLAGGRRSPEDRKDRGTFVLGPFVREWFYWALTPVLRLSLALGATPFFYNLLGVGLAILSAALFGTGRVALGGWLILLGGICDSLDGRVARARGMDAPHGAFLDSVLDRFAEVAVFIGLAVLLAAEPVAVPLVIAALGGSVVVSYARARGESLGVVCARGVMQRAERLLLLGLSAILDPTVGSWIGRDSPGGLLIPVLGLVALGTLGTAVYRTVWIARRLRPSAREPEDGRDGHGSR